MSVAELQDTRRYRTHIRGDDDVKQKDIIALLNFEQRSDDTGAQIEEHRRRLVSLRKVPRNLKASAYVCELNFIPEYRTVNDVLFYSDVLWENYSSRYSEVLSTLGRLKDGWAGPGTLAPTLETLRDLVSFYTEFNDFEIEPEIEVDEDTGSVSLRCYSEDNQDSLTMAFCGNGCVTITHSSIANPELGAKKISLDQGGKVVAFLRHDAIARFIGEHDEL